MNVSDTIWRTSLRKSKIIFMGKTIKSLSFPNDHAAMEECFHRARTIPLTEHMGNIMSLSFVSAKPLLPFKLHKFINVHCDGHAITGGIDSCMNMKHRTEIRLWVGREREKAIDQEN